MWRISVNHVNSGPSGKNFGHRKYFERKKLYSDDDIAANSKLKFDKKSKSDLPLLLKYILRLCILISFAIIIKAGSHLYFGIYNENIVYKGQFYVPLTINQTIAEPKIEKVNSYNTLNYYGLVHLQNDSLIEALQAYTSYYIKSEYNDESTIGITSSLVLLCVKNGMYCKEARIFYKYTKSKQINDQLLFDNLTLEEFKKI